MDLDEYQKRAHRTARSEDIEIYTLGLFGEAGSVASAIKKVKRDNPAKELVHEEIKREIGDVLWYLSEIAHRYDLTLSEVAEANLAKTEFLFTGDARVYDEGFPDSERFPALLTVRFDDEGSLTTISIDSDQIGNSLDDNSHIEDGYRFHDVFHLGYMTRLGWSPSMRRMLKRKRKSNAEVDRVEDGARSVFLEEGISAIVFNQSEQTAEGVSLFSDRGNIPFTILQALKTVTRGVEVSSRSISDWRDAISMGFQVFDQLVRNGGGIVSCDLRARSLSYDGAAS
ncbi:MAG: MazG nucleotide pyrophosphohydrolase domain-containing protein [Sphingosinicella sp.]|uniref:MazG nucleotide pyrophosphohydrolase domain-containing protein n=1 Tax=Sphingosinicella sp. TaxID=1917971 RepID=UPI00403837B9